MLSFEKTAEILDDGIKSKKMISIVGSCYVEYWGRAASKLPKGKRMLLIKGDNSIAVHQNRLLRPTNYMMNAFISWENLENTFILNAKKSNPKESIKIIFYEIEAVHSFEMNCSNDLRLFGSEKDLSNQLMQDLSFLEEGLKPIQQESPLRKGVIDILAEDKNGNIAVVEVKRRKADLNSVMQLHRYVKQVERIKSKKTRGILLAPEIGKHSRELLENYGLEFFSFEFEISNPKAKIKGIHKTQKTLFD